MYLKINALGDYKKKYDPFARLLALKRGVGVCSVVGVVSGFYGNDTSNPFYAQYHVIQGFSLKPGNSVCLVNGSRILKFSSMLQCGS